MECLARNFNVHYAKLQNIPLSTAANATEKTSADNNVESDVAETLSHKKFKASQETRSDRSLVKNAKSDASSHNFTSAVPAVAMQGHTGFLTFASIYLH